MPGSSSRQIVGANPVAALSSDGRLAVTMAAGSAHVWEVETGLPIGPPLAESGGTERVLFGDGANIIGFTGSGAVRTWGLAPDPRRPRTSRGSRGCCPAARSATTARWPPSRSRIWAAPGPTSTVGEPSSPIDPRWPRPTGIAARCRKRSGPATHSRPWSTSTRWSPPPRTDIGLRKRRADIEADLGRWEAAAADLGVVVKLGPNEADARASLAVLSARLGDLAGYRSHCNALLAMIRGNSMSGPVIVIVDLAALRPEGLDDPEALVKRLEPGKGRARPVSRSGTALGAAQYRAGQFEEARQSVRKSIAIYAGAGFVPFDARPEGPARVPPGGRRPRP